MSNENSVMSLSLFDELDIPSLDQFTHGKDVAKTNYFLHGETDNESGEDLDINFDDPFQRQELPLFDEDASQSATKSECDSDGWLTKLLVESVPPDDEREADKKDISDQYSAVPEETGPRNVKRPRKDDYSLSVSGLSPECSRMPTVLRLLRMDQPDKEDPTAPNPNHKGVLFNLLVRGYDSQFGYDCRRAPVRQTCH